MSKNLHPKVSFHAQTELLTLAKERATKQGKSLSALIVDALWFYLLNNAE